MIKSPNGTDYKLFTLLFAGVTLLHEPDGFINH
jgi:hypothetical protein